MVFRACAVSVMLLAAVIGSVSANEPTHLYFGDTHLHTSYSFDAYLNKNQSADPDTAYRWAKGRPVIHPYNRAKVQIGTPLDFLVVSDHAEILGVMLDRVHKKIWLSTRGRLKQPNILLHGSCLLLRVKWMPSRAI